MSHHLTAEAEDCLERLYMCEVEGSAYPPPPHDSPALAELQRAEYVRCTPSRCTLTKEGRHKAEKAVRRHRLAERLLHDIIDVQGQLVDRAACEFEHSLHHGVDDRICALLGHPTTCPHGRPIPPGKCCRERKDAASAVIAPLAEMRQGERGIIAYLSSKQPSVVQKLMSLGALPGSPIAVIQTFPSVVFEVGQTQVAVDHAIGGDIYVRRNEDTT